MGIDLTPFYVKNNFKIDGKLTYGIYRNNVVSVLFTGSFVKFTISFHRPMDRNVAEALSLKIKQIKTQYKLLQQGLVTNVALELMFYQSADFNDMYLKTLDVCIDALEESSKEGLETCPICGNILTTDAPFIRIRDTVIQAHESCVKQLEETTNKLQNSMKKMDKKSKTKEVAITAVLVGILLILAMFALGFTGLSVYYSSITGWVCLLICRGIFQKRKVPMTMKNMAILFAICTFTLLASMYFGCISYFYEAIETEHSFGQMFTDFTKILKDNPAFTSQLLYTLLLGLLLILPQFIFNIVMYRKQTKSMIKRL